jgi:uncharacterized protein involved in exopolysaccharide biosynthesis
MFKSIFLAFVLLGAASASFAQTKPQVKTSLADVSLRATPAYAELLLRKTDLEAELEALLMEYTEDYPKVRDLRLELDVLKPEIDRILALKPGDAGKLTQALGKLILGKAAHAASLKKLQMQFQDAHPNVRKAKRMVEIYEAAIKEILG